MALLKQYTGKKELGRHQKGGVFEMRVFFYVIYISCYFQVTLLS